VDFFQLIEIVNITAIFYTHNNLKHQTIGRKKKQKKMHSNKL